MSAKRSTNELKALVRKADQMMENGHTFQEALDACDLTQVRYDNNKILVLGEEALAKIRSGEKPGPLFDENEPPAPTMQTWECPRCRAIHVVWKGTCDCRPNGNGNGS